MSGIATRPPSWLELESALPWEAGEGAASVETVMSLSADSVSDKARSRMAPLVRQPLGAGRAYCVGALAQNAQESFRGQIGVVSEWARRRRLAEKADQSVLARTPSARSIAKLMTLAPGAT
jgi:hypothetical protein